MNEENNPNSIQLDAGLRREIKLAAKRRILLYLPRCLAAAVIYMLPAVLVGRLTAVSLDQNIAQVVCMNLIGIACEIFLLGPIMMGMQYFFVDTARGRMPGLSVVFSPLAGIRELLCGIRMTLCLVFRMILLWLIPTAIYSGALYGIVRWAQAHGVTDNRTILGMTAAVVLLYLLLLLPTLGRILSYMLGYAFLRDDPEMGVWHATREGSRLLRGQRPAMLAFALSFLPWWIGGIFTCGLTTLFGMIYLSVSLYMLGDRLCGQDTPIL